MKIIRGFKKRQYESYRVAAFHIYYMAQMLTKDPKPYHPDRIQPPWDERDLTAEQRRERDTYRKKEQTRERDKMFEKK